MVLHQGTVAAKEECIEQTRCSGSQRKGAPVYRRSPGAIPGRTERYSRKGDSRHHGGRAEIHKLFCQESAILLLLLELAHRGDCNGNIVFQEVLSDQLGNGDSSKAYTFDKHLSSMQIGKLFHRHRSICEENQVEIRIYSEIRIQSSGITTIHVIKPPSVQAFAWVFLGYSICASRKGGFELSGPDLH